MPQIASWSRLPEAIRRHLVERMRDRQNKLCGADEYPKTFLLAGQAATGQEL